LAVGVIFYVLPWMGLELLDTARAVAEFDLPMRVLGLWWGDPERRRARSSPWAANCSSHPWATRSSFASLPAKGGAGVWRSIAVLVSSPASQSALFIQTRVVIVHLHRRLCMSPILS
jgi:hypothetical protein